MAESGNPFAFRIALRRGVTLSALFEMNKIGELVLPVNGPEIKSQLLKMPCGEKLIDTDLCNAILPPYSILCRRA
jgi:hypothetical protein